MKIYTIGYGNRKTEDFIFLLRNHGVKIVVDVRRYPVSKYPGFTKAELEKTLPQHGIEYIFMGDTLGGFRRGYKQYTSEEIYTKGIKDLLAVAEKGNTAIMCLEQNYKGCHRRFIAETLMKMNVEVHHI
jgi:uncharacterized protein (DUF488 family)